MSKGIFVTGIGTDIGKTYVTALIVKYLNEKGYRASYYKAAVSGNPEINGVVIPEDARYVVNIAKLSESPNDLVSYSFKEAISPHLASIRENVKIQMSKIKEDYKRICDKNEFVTVEGSGGILCPIRYDDEKIWLEDIIHELDLPVLIVSNAKLGSINSTGLTVSYLRSKNIKIKGIILNEFDENNFMEADNKKMIEELTGIKVIAIVKKNALSCDFTGIEELYE